MKHLLTGLLVALLSATVYAKGLDPALEQMRASMLLSGSIEVGPDGSVRSYSLDRADRVPAEVRGLVDKAAHVWKFEPILQDGKPAIAKAKMSLRIVATPVDNEHMTISIAGAQFGQKGNKPGEEVSYKDRAPPRYPMSAVQARVSGTVYLLLRVNRQGRVADALAQQINLDVRADKRSMERWRKVLGDAALRATSQWTFNPPTSGKHLHDDYWVARVPVVFNLRPSGMPIVDEYGKWRGYMPGPLQPVMWPDKDKMFSGAADAISGDGLFQLDQGLHLTTPLNGA
ncbi:MAG TPA: energy transducer TonB [Rhodanobacter sp.]